MIETSRLRLRLPRAEDVEDVLSYRSRPDVARYLRGGIWTRQKTRREIASYSSVDFMGSGDELVLFVELRSPAVVVGEVGLVRGKDPREAELGFVFNPDFGSQGYATEAVGVVLAEAPRRWEIDRVIAVADEANSASRALCERIGMHLESIAASQDGRRVSECTYSLGLSGNEKYSRRNKNLK